jgi:hypothetical protein
MARAREVRDWKALVDDIEAFWPSAAKPTPDAEASWLDAYANDPAASYREAPPAARAALDHRLWADAFQHLLEDEAAEAPALALALADQAEARLADRPEVAARLLDRGLKAASADLGALRRREVLDLARAYRERLRQPERAQSLIRDWLDDQRTHRLSPTDAEGRVALAAQYHELLGDKTAAVDLLREAWKIDPGSKEVAAAFRAQGFRKVDDEWVEAPRPSGDSDPASHPSPPRDARLLGSTPREVRDRLGGKPDRVAFSASQGQVIEQWIYLGPRQNRYVNFLRSPGETQPRVVAYYSIPSSVRDVTPRPK